MQVMITSEHNSNRYEYLYSAKRGSNDWINGFKGNSELVLNVAKKDLFPNIIYSCVVQDDENNGELNEPKAAVGDVMDEDEYEVFNLPIIHRKNRLAAILFLMLLMYKLLSKLFKIDEMQGKL